MFHRQSPHRQNPRPHPAPRSSPLPPTPPIVASLHPSQPSFVIRQTLVPAISPTFSTTQKGRPATGRPFLLWEAAPTEAKPSELSGARVCSTLCPVKKVFRLLSSLAKSTLYMFFYHSRRFSPVFFPASAAPPSGSLKPLRRRPLATPGSPHRRLSADPPQPRPAGAITPSAPRTSTNCPRKSAKNTGGHAIAAKNDLA